MADDTGRPDPLGDAVKSETPASAAVGTILGALLGAGLITASGVTTVNIVLAIAAVLVPPGTALLAARRVAKAARPGVTPSLDPRTDSGDELVPRTGALLADVLEQVATILAPSPTGLAAAPPAAAPTSLAAGAPPPPVRAAALLAAPATSTYPDYSPDRLWPEDQAAARAPRVGRHRPPGPG